MGVKYYDTSAVIQVIACSLLKPSLLEEDGVYFYNEEDFVNEFHKIVFGTIKNLHATGAEKIGIIDIENYLEKRPISFGVFKAGKGVEWLKNALDNADLNNFDYYYQRMKKMSLLRAYSERGIDMRFLYDPNELFDSEKKRKQEDNLDRMTLEEISDLVDNKIIDIRATYVENSVDDTKLLGDSVLDVLAQLKETPLIGSPLYGKYINTIHRGARLGAYYIRSSATNIGKTRSMIGDVCYLACDEIYDLNTNSWIKNNLAEATLYITTEQTCTEITTMCLAFLSGVNEEKIVKSTCNFEEYERVMYAAKILQRSPLYIEEMPDFTMKQVENCIKRNIRINGIQYCFFDYIQSSVSILGEIARQSGGTKLREDNILFLLSAHLKDIATKFNIFIETSTQLNGSYKDEKIPDQNLLRGAKSIADRADFGSILLATTQEDAEEICGIVKSLNVPMPNVKLSIYKNRAGSWNRIYLWMYADRGICRFDGLFVTDYDYNYLEIKDTFVNVLPKGE